MKRRRRRSFHVTLNNTSRIIFKLVFLLLLFVAEVSIVVKFDNDASRLNLLFPALLWNRKFSRSKFFCWVEEEEVEEEGAAAAAEARTAGGCLAAIALKLDEAVEEIEEVSKAAGVRRKGRLLLMLIFGCACAKELLLSGEAEDSRSDSTLPLLLLLLLLLVFEVDVVAASSSVCESVERLRRRSMVNLVLVAACWYSLLELESWVLLVVVVVLAK